jgi:hypothetical protein
MLTGQMNIEIKIPIQKDEHSIHNSIFLKRDGKYFATIFLGFRNKSDKDHIQLVPIDTNKYNNK